MLLKGQLIREDHMKCFTLLRKQKARAQACSLTTGMEKDVEDLASLRQYILGKQGKSASVG